jgi:hypothetical protein
VIERPAATRVVLYIASALLLVMLSASGRVLFHEGERRTRGEPPEDFIPLYLVSWRLRHGRSGAVVYSLAIGLFYWPCCSVTGWRAFCRLRRLRRQSLWPCRRSR